MTEIHVKYVSKASKQVRITLDSEKTRKDTSKHVKRGVDRAGMAGFTDGMRQSSRLLTNSVKTQVLPRAVF